MKTKIIYISGNEVFEMSEIRAAFEEVRAALGLDNDTILFGVPVDSDNALTDQSAQNTEHDVMAVTESVEQNFVEEQPQQDITEPAIAQIVEEIPSETHEDLITVAEEAFPENEDLVDEITETAEETEPETIEKDEEKVIPILSVLGTKQPEPESAQVAEPATDQISYIKEEENIVTDEIPQEIISDVNMETQIITPVAEETIQDTEFEQVTIGDMIDEDAPVAPMEKTLEQLLESMTPLREDVIADNVDENIDTPVTFDESDTDATLAQLASEFAENEDKISTPKKVENQGKIGKLKNILPFKKAKRDDSGLMGDLFGWAGIAANDEDFSIPGFFANAKKQGA